MPDDKFNTNIKQFKFKYLSDDFITRFDLNEGAEGEYSDENHKKIREKIIKILKEMLPCYKKNKKDKNNARKKIIIAASGMCEEGAVVDVLKKYLPNEKAAVVLTGFQAEDTNGWKLRELNSFDEDYKRRTRLRNVGVRLSDIKCEIINELIPYYSGHADQSQLVDYIKDVVNETPQTTVFLNHGVDDSRNTLKEEIEKKYNHEKIKVSVELPPLNRWINLNTGETEIEEAAPVLTNNNPLKYFNVNNIHLYLPAIYDDNKISEIINFLLKQ
ncbi:MAG: hypothetical protein LBG43_04405 [Treponema sp.]|nr:hypothetical protein [Treponema sp.]